MVVLWMYYRFVSIVSIIAQNGETEWVLLNSVCHSSVLPPKWFPFLYKDIFACFCLWNALLTAWQWENLSYCPPISVWIITFFFILIGRHKIQSNDFYVYDALIMISGVYVYQHITGFIRTKQCLAFFGKYSMDMFLIHGFFYKWWMHDIIYYTGNPFIIYITLIAISLVVAIAIEKVK